jgi:hypothetical protein
VKARGTISGLALLKVAAIALICPSVVLTAQRQGGVQANQAPRPTYQSAQPATQPAKSAQANQNTQQRPSLYGNGQRPSDQMRAIVPPGHLADWLNQHRNLPPAQQEQLLLRDPYFLRLNPTEQRKVLDQLHRIGNMNDDERSLRLARAEAIERLSPQDKMQVNASAQRMLQLPEDRRQMLRKAFRDLRAVPPGDRDMVLSSAYYRTTFSPAERIILHDLLRVEPYVP